MWIDDLAPCTYFPGDAKVAAVGWLERGKPYNIGHADREVYQALVAMKANPWQPFLYMGMHECDLCRFEGDHGSANLFIPGDGVIYVSPELIVHYMNAHGYSPPETFCRAVISCPPMRSMQYLNAINECGGGRLLRPSGGDL